MAKSRVLLISVIAIALAVAGIVVGLGLAGAIGSGDSPSEARTPQTATPTIAEVAVQPDPNYREELAKGIFSPSGWKTDFSLHTVPYENIVQAAAARDGGIPAIDNPVFISRQEADGWLFALEPVIAFESNGEARAYPIEILIFHEIVNDVVGGTPVAVTYCPLCNSAITFDRRVDGATFDFGVSGNLLNSDLIMYDRQTHSWWQQLTGEGIVGENAGKRLTILPSFVVSWRDFKAVFPDGEVLSQDTGFARAYGFTPYEGYDDSTYDPFLFYGELDPRLPSKERVAAVSVGDVDIAFPFSKLRNQKVVNHSVNGQDIVVFFKPQTVSPLNRTSIIDSLPRGAAAVFDPNLDGERLTFSADGEDLVDDQTGSVWNILGRAIEGPLEGSRLPPATTSPTPISGASCTRLITRGRQTSPRRAPADLLLWLVSPIRTHSWPPRNCGGPPSWA